MNTCKHCGKPLTLTPEYDICMECQGRIMRESTIPQGAFVTNSTQQMITHEEARNLLNELVPTDAITPSQIDDLHIYITEQEKKEERAKKEHKLLRLYKQRDYLLSNKPKTKYQIDIWKQRLKNNQYTQECLVKELEELK